MINPIHDQAYQEYTRVSRQRPIDTQEKFSLDAAAHQSPSPDADTNGVIYEPAEKTVHAEPSQETPRHASSVTDTVKHFVQNMLQTIKKVLSAIWESKPADAADAAADTAAQDIPGSYDTATDSLAVKDISDEDIKKALKAGDADSFRALLSQDGKRIPARNSSLLTYYDATGKLVNIDPSEQYRILHGDHGSLKS